MSNLGDQNKVSGPQTLSPCRFATKDVHRMNKTIHKGHNRSLKGRNRGVCLAAKESVATTSKAERFLEDLDDENRVSLDDGDAIRQEVC